MYIMMSITYDATIKAEQNGDSSFVRIAKGDTELLLLCGSYEQAKAVADAMTQGKSPVVLPGDFDADVKAAGF